MEWFEKPTGLKELGYHETRRQLEVQGDWLQSRANGKPYATGLLEAPSVRELRQRALDGIDRLNERLKVSCVAGDVRAMPGEPNKSQHALFQVASQFNLLEMIGPDVTREHGVTRYESDGTQGPAYAIAAGAATTYRNYFAEVNDQSGQTRDSQFDCLRDLGIALGNAEWE